MEWGSGFSGSGTFRLVRDLEVPGRCMSFAPWESFEAQRAWKEDPEFREWKWIEPAQLPDLIVPFKRELYRQLLREFAAYL